MADEQTLRAWVTNTIGFTFPDDGGGAAARSAETKGEASALATWTGAKDAADAQLNVLYATLRNSGLPVLREIAGDIENTLQGFRVGLVASLMSYDQSTGPQRDKAREQAAKAVAAAQARLASDPRIRGAEDNPFGLPVTLQSTLGGALRTLQRQLQA